MRTLKTRIGIFCRELFRQPVKGFISGHRFTPVVLLFSDSDPAERVNEAYHFLIGFCILYDNFGFAVNGQDFLAGRFL